MTTPGVKEKEAGTMLKPEGNQTPSAESGTPVEQNVSPDDAPIYTQKQADALLHANDSQWGRKVKETEEERDSLKAQINAKEKELDDIQAERESLQNQLDDLASGDPKKFDIIQKDRALREQERSIRAKQRELETREEAWKPREEEYNKWKRDQLVYSVADDYVTAEGEAVDMNSFKDRADKFGFNEREQLENLADIMGLKRKDAPAPPTQPKIYTGRNEGGKPYFTRTEIADRQFWLENKEEIMKAEAEGRIRNE